MESTIITSMYYLRIYIDILYYNNIGSVSVIFDLFQVTYRADSLVLDFLKLAQDGNPLFSVIGELEWKCQDIGPGNPLAFKDNEGQKNYMVSKKKKRNRGCYC